MLWIWIFWIETLAFAGYLLWSLLSILNNRPLTGYQWAGVVIYGVAFVWGLYGFGGFLRRRLGAARPGSRQ